MFEVGGDTARLEFEDGSALDGSVVRVSLDVSVREYLDIERAASVLPLDDAPASELLDRWEALYRMFGERYLLAWDLTLGGEPIPPTADGMLALPFRYARAIFLAWKAALSSPLPNSLAVFANGAMPEAGLARMEAP